MAWPFERSIVLMRCLIATTLASVLVPGVASNDSTDHFKIDSALLTDQAENSIRQTSGNLWQPLLDVPSTRFKRIFLPSYLSFESDESIWRHLSAPCADALRHTLHALEMRQTWAVSLFNSWGQFPPTGLRRGTLTDFGDYDQCLSTSEYLSEFSSLRRRHMSTQYCLLDISVPMPTMPSVHNYFHQTPLTQLIGDVQSHENNRTSFVQLLANESSVFHWATVQLGVCLPNSCTRNDVSTLAQQIGHSLGLDSRRFDCQPQPDAQTNQWNMTQRVALIFFCTLLCLTLIATVYDQMTNHLRCKVEQQRAIVRHFRFLRWFALGRNIRKVIDPNSTEVDLACVHGLRVFSIVWVVVGHTLEWNQVNAFRDTFQLKHMLASLPLQLLFKAPLAVETFFYLSGLLTSYITLNFTQTTSAKFNAISFLTIRYVRLTPQLAVFMLLTALLPVMYNGPIWSSYMGKITHNCSANWWLNLAYLQNFFNFENICGIHTWFLANDMQLHWLSLLPMMALLRNRRLGLLVTVSLLIVTLVLCALKIFTEHGFPPETVITTKTDFRDANENPSNFYYFYFKPWIHIVSFFGGFLFGDHIYHQQRKSRKPAQMSRIGKYLAWLSILALYLFNIYCSAPYLRGRPYDPLVSALIFPLTRVVWACILSAVIWLCLTGNGGVVGRLLSWSALKPLSRLTYAVYLTHAWTVWATLGARRQLIEPSPRTIVTMCGGVLLSAYVVAFIFSLLVESPLLNAMKAYKKAKRLIPSSGDGSNNNAHHHHHLHQHHPHHHHDQHHQNQAQCLTNSCIVGITCLEEKAQSLDAINNNHQL